MINDFLLWSGNQIPLPSALLMINQPKIKDLSLIEEDDLFVVLKALTFSKEKFNYKDKISLENKSNFEIIMSIFENPKNTKSKLALNMLLCLLFPEYNVNVEDRILLVNTEDKQNPIKIIDSSNFDEFSEIIREMFCIKDLGGDQDFNPVNEEARRIAEKIKKGRAVAARDKGEILDENNSLLKHYSKVLCMNGYTPEQVNNMTLYQLYELFDMFRNKIIYEDWYKAKLQGAKDIDDVEHWINLSNNK